MTVPSIPAPLGADAAAREIAAIVGEDANNVVVRNAEWEKFLQDGLLVRLHIGRWRGKSLLSLEDLGIQPETTAQRKAFERVLTLGSRYILPRQIMKKAEGLESKARYALEKRSFRTFWGRWIHVSKYAEWREVNEQIRAEYLALAQEIQNTWEDLLEQSRQDYVILGLQTYNRLVQAGALAVSSTEREVWVREFVARSMAQVWNVERVVSSFTYAWKSEFVALAQQVATDQAAAGAIRLSQAEQLMLEDVRRTAAEQAAEGCQRLAADLIAEVREQVYKVAVDALENLRKNDGRLGRNSSKGLNNLIEQMTSMVFWSDPALEQRIASVQRIVQTPANRRSESELNDALVSLGAEARLVLTELDRTPLRSAQSVGISDEIGELRQTVARRAGSNVLELGTVEIRQGARRGDNNLEALAI